MLTRAAVMRWLRRRFWQIEDAIVDLIDWQPRPAPQLKPPRRAPLPKPHHYVKYNWTSVGFSRADAKDIDAEWQQQIFRQMAKSRFFEIRC